MTKEELREKRKRANESLNDIKALLGLDALYIDEIEKENAELKKNYEDSLIACGVLKAKVDTLAQSSPLESMQDALITTQKVVNEKQKEQLTKAKDHIKKLLDCLQQDTNDPQTNYYVVQYMTEAEQFLSEVEK